jgi:Anion-transporting ATPase
MRKQGHRIVFVTGKGGVGKSMVAAATALQRARAGSDVLLVEFGSRSFYGSLFGLPVDQAAAGEAVHWQPGIEISRWDAESALREYLTHYLVFKSASAWILGGTAMKALVAVAPGLSELAVLGKLTAPMLHRWYKRDAAVVVVDGYATGQFMSLLRAPRGLAATAGPGPLHDQAKAITNLLRDPAICEYRLVTLAEEMPVAEACEMAADLRAETGIAPIILCNRLLDLPSRLPAVPAGTPAALFLEDLARISRRQKRALAQLTAVGNEPEGAVRRLPMIPSLEPLYLIEQLADTLEATP